jgi:hypothetical protein
MDHNDNIPAPTSKVSLDLDALEREGAPEPFSIHLAGRVYPFIDAMELDWQDLMSAMQDPARFFALTLSGDDHKAFLNTKLSSWKLRKLMDSYREHHGMVEPGE